VTAVDESGKRRDELGILVSVAARIGPAHESDKATLVGALGRNPMGRGWQVLPDKILLGESPFSRGRPKRSFEVHSGTPVEML
jgi:hypothetical protein